VSRRPCCAPDEHDEFRSHHVRYVQTQLRNGREVWEDTGSEYAGTHSDALAAAEAMAGRFDCGMKPRGRNGTWMGSEVIDGDGQRAQVWLDRTVEDEEYDVARTAEIEAHNAACAAAGVPGPDAMVVTGVYRDPTEGG
jgi:hypothetical protein